MKKSSKFLAVILAVITILTAVAIPSFADAEAGNFYGDYEYVIYDPYETGEYVCVLIDYTGDSADMLIPTEIEGVKVTQFGGSIGYGIKNFKVERNNTQFTTIDGVLFSKDKKTVVLYPKGRKETSYVIPNGVTRIANGAFSDCTNLKSVTIPNSVKEIGIDSFAYCSNLKSVTVPASVSNIGYGAFVYYDENWNVVYIQIKGYKGTYVETYADSFEQPFTSLGSIPTSKTGLYKVGDTWCYVKGGKVNYDYTGIAKYGTKWYYVEDGVKDASFTGLVKHSSKWYYVNKGIVDKSYTGLVKRGGKWYHVSKGVVDFDYTGLSKYGTKWYYVEDGKLDKTYTGLCKYSGKWYYVEDGVVDKTYTGLCKRSGKWYYVKKGVVDFTYTGNVKYNGKTYKVVKGVKV